jgi:hypothetical protein
MFLRLTDISVIALPMSAEKLDFSKFVMWAVLSQQLIQRLWGEGHQHDHLEAAHMPWRSAAAT